MYKLHMRVSYVALLGIFLLQASPALGGELLPASDVVAADVPDDGGGKIEVKWTASPSEQVTKYEIVRFEGSGPGEVRGEKTAMDTSFTDERSDDAPLVDGKEYRYLVRARGVEGQSVDSKTSNAAAASPSWFDRGKAVNCVGVLLFGAMFVVLVVRGRRGARMFIRPIAAIEAIDDAVGRAAEMGKPILYVPGLSDIAHPSTVASMGVLSRVGEKAVRLWTGVKVPNYSPLVWPVTQNVMRQAYARVGRPDEFDPDDVPYFTSRFLTFATAVAGIMVREKTATNFLIGHFYSEALILAETGASTGAVQIGGTDSEAQLPFFVTTCDETMIGEELFAAAALLGDDAVSRSTIKSHDWFKLVLLALMVAGLLASIGAALGSDGAAEAGEWLVGLLKGGD